MILGNLFSTVPTIVPVCLSDQLVCLKNELFLHQIIVRTLFYIQVGVNFMTFPNHIALQQLGPMLYLQFQICYNCNFLKIAKRTERPLFPKIEELICFITSN